MKLLAFTDVHGDKDSMNKIIEMSRKYNPDYLICAGDISVFSDNLDALIGFFKKTKKQLMIIPGNHEDPEELKHICKNHKDVIYLHKKIFRINGYSFIGFGGGGFSARDTEFENFVKNFGRNDFDSNKLVLVTHGPIYKTRTDLIPGLGHRGCKSYRKFIEEFQPKLAISGHFHETFNKVDNIKKSFVINPGPNGKILEI